MSQFAFSLNGENWQGVFPTREAALKAALQRCSGASDPPGSVFVAEIPASEAFAHRLGYILVKEMRIRALARGQDNATAYLRDISVDQMDQLDHAIESALMHWLHEHHLLPETAKVCAISEHPVPLPHRALSAARTDP